MARDPGMSEPKDVRNVGRFTERGGKRSRQSWCLDTLRGRFVEVSGSATTAALTVTATLILQVQHRGEWAIWVAGRESTFFPPDFASSGIDLEALPVVRAGDAKKALRVADTLLRSGGFALVILDLGKKAALPLAVQSRLTGLAKSHDTAVLCITEKDPQVASVGSLVSIRAAVEKERTGFNRFACRLHVVKDKRYGPGECLGEVFCGSDGLC